MVFVYVNRYLCEIKLHAWFSLNIYIFIVRAVIYMAWNEHRKSLTHNYEHIVMYVYVWKKETVIRLSLNTFSRQFIDNKLFLQISVFIYHVYISFLGPNMWISVQLFDLLISLVFYLVRFSVVEQQEMKYSIWCMFNGWRSIYKCVPLLFEYKCHIWRGNTNGICNCIALWPQFSSYYSHGHSKELHSHPNLKMIYCRHDYGFLWVEEEMMGKFGINLSFGWTRGEISIEHFHFIFFTWPLKLLCITTPIWAFVQVNQVISCWHLVTTVFDL